jgi:hypothetical protein
VGDVERRGATSSQQCGARRGELVAAWGKAARGRTNTGQCGAGRHQVELGGRAWGRANGATSGAERARGRAGDTVGGAEPGRARGQAGRAREEDLEDFKKRKMSKKRKS